MGKRKPTTEEIISNLRDAETTQAMGESDTYNVCFSSPFGTICISSSRCVTTDERFRIDDTPDDMTPRL